MIGSFKQFLRDSWSCIKSWVIFALLAIDYEDELAKRYARNKPHQTSSRTPAEGSATDWA